MPALLELNKVTKLYAHLGGICEVSFQVARGEVVGLLGPNGAGKSTALHCITGILQPDSGSIVLDGLAQTEPEAKDVFGFLPDDLPMPESLRADELITLHRRLRPRFDASLAQEWLRLVGLDGHGAKYFGEYSHGMKRKLQLALALAHRPQLLVMDEPLRGLDPEAALLVNRIMEAFIAADGAVLVSTHDLLAAQRYCTRVVILAEGSVVAQGVPDELVASGRNTTLEDFFISITGLDEAIEEKQDQIRSLLGIEKQGGRLSSLQSRRT